MFSTIVTALLVGFPVQASAWGLVTHRMINEQAIATLPEPLRAFFVNHRGEVSDRAVEPDTVRRGRYGRREAIQHYIDLDLYGEPPFSALPRSHREAVRRFGKETVDERGTLPWTILRMHAKLTREMRAGRWQSAVTVAGLAGHYVADAFMPLHTTDNHDGQRSRQQGIHKAIEHDLVDARLRSYQAKVESRIGPARPEPFAADSVFAFLIDSYGDVAPLLRADREARKHAKFGSSRYLDALDERAANILTARLAKAVTTLGSFWLSAWEEAGKPAVPVTVS